MSSLINNNMHIIFNLKLFPHLVHGKGSSPVWLFWWHVSSESKIKLFAHVWHVWDFFLYGCSTEKAAQKYEESALHIQDILRAWIVRTKAKFPRDLQWSELSSWPLSGGLGIRAVWGILCTEHAGTGWLMCAYSQAKQDLFSDQNIYQSWYIHRPFLVSVGFFWCCANPGNHVKPLPRKPHGEGCSFMWTHMCWDRCERWRKLLLRPAHSPGFSPTWILPCILRFAPWLKIFPQASCLYFFSPE